MNKVNEGAHIIVNSGTKKLFVHLANLKIFKKISLIQLEVVLLLHKFRQEIHLVNELLLRRNGGVPFQVVFKTPFLYLDNQPSTWVWCIGEFFDPSYTLVNRHYRLLCVVVNLYYQKRALPLLLLDWVPA